METATLITNTLRRVYAKDDPIARRTAIITDRHIANRNRFIINHLLYIFIRPKFKEHKVYNKTACFFEKQAVLFS